MNPKDTHNLLLIEDDTAYAEALASNLRSEGYSTSRATKVADAFWKLRNQKFDAILLDVNLEQGGSGEDILAQIRSDNKECNYATPVIIVSGSLSKSLILRLGPIAKVSILVKPFQPEQLSARLKAAILGNAVAKATSAETAKPKHSVFRQEELTFLHDLSSPLGTLVLLLAGT